MLFIMAAIASAFTPAPPALVAQRIVTAEAWITRTQSRAKMAYAMGDNVTTVDSGHGVNGIGLYIPRWYMSEYDNILFTIADVFGFAPVLLSAKWDAESIIWLDTDVLKVYYFADDKAGFNFATGGYDLIADNFRYIEYIKFVPNSPLIYIGYSYPETAERLFFEIINSATSPDALCGLIVAACASTPYWNETGYESYGDCVNFITSLGPDVSNKCPYKNSGNTIACRQVHATLSLIDPAIHCAHAAKVSHKCYDSCFPACANCNANARCVATPNTTDFSTNYACVCNAGYKGDGVSCVAQACKADNTCKLEAGTGGCVNGLCSCKPSFTWNQVTGKCECPAPAKAFWSGKGKGAVQECIAEGSCNERYQCSQDWNDVKCRPEGNNVFVKNRCYCNRGFGAGVELPCVCNGGRVVWSDIDDGNVCLKGSNCVVDYNCPRGAVCVGATATAFGTCSA